MAKQPADGGRGRTPAKGKVIPKRNQKGFYTVLGLVGAAFAVLLIYQTSKPREDGATRIDPSTPLPEAKGYTMGKADAPVRVIEFADFECPACEQFFSITEPDVRTRLVETGIVRYTYMDFPLPMHFNTWPASHAAACANEQEKFWEMHDGLFRTQDAWNSTATKRPKEKFEDLAREIGLDVGKWEDCYDDRKFLANIQSHEREAGRQGASQTPTFIIGTRRVPGSISYDKFKAYVDTALAEAKAAAPVADTAAGK